MALCLACEFISKISQYQNIFSHECKVVKKKLLTLADKIVDNFEDEKIERVFLDVDFKDRTILKLVTDNGF